MKHEFLKIGFLTTDKKAKNKQIRNLVERLEAFGEFKAEIVRSSYLDKLPAEEWPIFDVFIPYHLDFFTIDKALEYVRIRKPFLFNDLESQAKIQDRRHIYECLRKNGIPCLENFVYDHTDQSNPHKFEENDDYIQTNGMRIYRPFVEKPLSARRHDINIYYSKAMGRGVRKLFRKIKNVSSQYYPGPSQVRRDGTYIYERLIDSVKDIKVYAVLDDYCYTEMRKSPNVDGVVERNAEGFEKREFCPLTYEEALIARKIIKVFKQNVCGFDIIREDEKKLNSIKKVRSSSTSTE
ncbi:hypothetical protein MHBO_000598 [Bonamia ostreae]|uniref:VIP1 N-terminal domain-containing protein n=1 Tax=Bonamia ostreae TaxID=126728 RepID=A0ABV2AG51_9EUKA